LAGAAAAGSTARAARVAVGRGFLFGSGSVDPMTRTDYSVPVARSP
jgi:hypothetical protein